MNTRTSLAWKFSFVFGLGFLLGIGAILLIQHLRESLRLSLIHHEANHLWLFYNKWIESGKPTGAKLNEFAKDFDDSDVKVEQRNIRIENTLHQTLFRGREISAYAEGAVYVTDDGKFVWERTKNLPLDQQSK